MEIGIGLPGTVAGVTGAQILDWARRAEHRRFSCLAVLDRLVYPNYEPLIELAAAAAVTDRIRLATTILIGPYRANAALLGKQLATIHHLSNGRLLIGIAAGSREDDYAVSGVDFATRGRRFDAMLDELDLIWAEPGVGSSNPISDIGPKPLNGRPTLIFGGMAGAAFQRAASRGDGWILGGGTADQFRGGAQKLSAAWSEAGRDDAPRTMALAYFALGDDAPTKADAYLRHYYAWLGDAAASIAQGAATNAAAVRERVSSFAEAGCDELVFIPCDADPGQVDLLADALP